MLNGECTKYQHMGDPSPNTGRPRGWLREIRPHSQAPAPASTATTIADAVDRIGPQPVEWACEVGYAMASHIIDEIPELGGGAEPFATLRMGTESATIRCLLRLSGTVEPVPAITDEALTGVVEFVRRGIGLDRVLRGVRLGHAQMAKAFLSECSALLPASDRIEQMQHVSDELFDYIDEFSGGMASTYIAERDQWMASAAAARDEAVRQILRGEPVDVAAAQKVLNYDLNRRHVAITLWYDPSLNRANTSELQTVAHDVLHQLGAIQRLVVPIGAGRLWAWGNRRQFEPAASSDLPRPSQRDIRLAIGTPCGAVEGFGQSHNEALAAERVARMTTSVSEHWVTDYAEIAVPAMLIHDLDVARHFVLRELGSLASATPHAADLRATLLAYFDEESSPFAAARRLHVSRNTVGYRVKRACELLGYDISTRRYPLHTALILADRFGSEVLGTGETT